MRRAESWGSQSDYYQSKGDKKMLVWMNEMGRYDTLDTYLELLC